MLTLVTVHDDTTLGLQFPGTGIHIEHDDIHAQVHSRLLSAETGAQTIVEEDHHQCLVLTQMLILITVVLDLLCFGERLFQRADIFYIDKTLHIVILFSNLSFSFDEPFVCADLLQCHRAARAEFLGGDTNLSTKPELGAIGK